MNPGSAMSDLTIKDMLDEMGATLRRYGRTLERIYVTIDAPPDVATTWINEDDIYEMVIHPSVWQRMYQALPSPPDPTDFSPWYFAGIPVVFGK